MTPATKAFRRGLAAVALVVIVVAAWTAVLQMVVR